MESEPSPPPGAKPPALRSRNGNNFSATFPEPSTGFVQCSIIEKTSSTGKSLPSAHLLSAVTAG
ncbi:MULTISPECIES: hypothetical protein [Rhodococcus]|uniref:hypothetical protein n=1 Tax=Rhodococcus TaxID=1827 RepID=UPI0025B4DDFF|nr:MULTISPECIES: hypothetical protein [Rhodococcus]MDN3460040.1 hypothetical protein [Rhodococcus sp. APC 3903]MDT9664758.1 hypothetical protein [Rhodococcus qingshengii]